VGVLVLLSSGVQPRYADDIVRILALPRGGQLQFRYDVRLLSPWVLEKLPREGLAGAQALVCFLASSGPSSPRQIVPVRLATVVRAELIGSSCVFTLEANFYVPPLGDLQIRNAVVARERDKLPLAPTSDPEGEGYFAFFASLDWWSLRREEAEAFEATARALAVHSPFDGEGTLFYSVHRLAKVATTSWFGTWPRPLRPSAGVYCLASRRRYQVEIYSFAPGRLGPDTHLRVESEDEFIHFVTPRSIAVDSRYDVKRIVFSTDAEVLARAGGMRVYLTHGNAEAKDADVRQDIGLQFIFGGSWLLGLLRAGAIGIGTAGPAMVAANAAGKLSVGVAIVMIALGAVAGLGAVFVSLKKP